MTKRILILVLTLILSMSLFVQAEEQESGGEIVISVEAFTLGGGYLIEPTYIRFYNGENLATVFVRLLDEKGYTCEYTGEIESDFYLGALYGNKVEDIVKNPNPPQAVLDECGVLDTYYEYTDKNGNYGLSACDFTYMSGWMYFLNNGIADLGMSQIYPADGDSVRVQFSLWGYGADLGSGWFGSYYEVADRDTLHKAIAGIGYENVPEEYKPTIENICASQEEIDKVTAGINIQKNKTTVAELKEITDGIAEWAEGEEENLFTAEFLKNAGSTSSDWLAMDFGRYSENSGDYLNAARIYVEQKYEASGKLHSSKATEWHRIALAVLANGGDPTYFGKNRYGDVNTYIDLIADGTYDNSRPTAQGINGPAWALITLNTLGFEVPEGKSYTEEYFINYIMSKQTPDLGFALSGLADPDITSMAILALSPYYNDDKTYAAYGREMKTVGKVIDEAVEKLGNMQCEDGDFASWDTRNSESTSWALTALCALGIDCEKDLRFIKNGNTLIDGMLKYRHESGGFMHTFDAASAMGKADRMATEQAFYALQSYLNIRTDKRHFFDFRPEKNNISKAEDIKINQPWVGIRTAMFEIESKTEKTVTVTAKARLDGTVQSSVSQIVSITAGKSDYGINLSGLLDKTYDKVDFEITDGEGKIAEYSYDYIANGVNTGSDGIKVLQPEMGDKSATIMIKSKNKEKITAAFAVYNGDKLSGIKLNEIELCAGTDKYLLDMPENAEFDTAKVIIYDSAFAPVADVAARYN